MEKLLTASLPTESEYQFWYDRCLKDYAEGKMKANGLTKQEAHELALSSLQRLLPNKYESPDQYFRVLKNTEGQLVGFYWFAVIGANDNRKAFIYDIIVEENFRGQGLGREAMLMIEAHVRSLGLKQVGLHVFSYNKTAVKLYETLGYETTDLVMEKSLE